jgi:hypothetical protein
MTPEQERVNAMRVKPGQWQALLAFGLVLAWHWGNPAPAAAQRPTPQCGVFFDKARAAGVPPAMLAMFEVGHEVMAAQACVAAGNVPGACEHWRRALQALDNADPSAAAELRPGIMNLMQQNNCSS